MKSFSRPIFTEPGKGEIRYCQFNCQMGTTVKNKNHLKVKVNVSRERMIDDTERMVPCNFRFTESPFGHHLSFMVKYLANYSPLILIIWFKLRKETSILSRGYSQRHMNFDASVNADTEAWYE